MAYREEYEDRARYDRYRRSPDTYTGDRRKRQRSGSPSFEPYPPPQSLPPRPPPRYNMPLPRYRVPPPESLEYLVSRRHFETYLQDAYPHVYEDKPRLDEAWTRYKSDFLRKYYHLFVQEHSSEPWFKERYDPAYEDLRKRLRLKGSEGKIDAWLQTLSKGHLQALSYDVGGKNVGLALEDGQGETAASPKEDDADAMQNTKQVEKARSMYGLVSAFRNKDPCVDALYNSEDALPVPISEYQLVIKSVSKDISRETLEKHCAQAPGFDYLSFLDPNPQKRFHRVAFVNFKPGSNMPRAEEILFESKINNFVLHMNRATQSNLQRIKQFPEAFNDPDRIRHDLSAVKAMVARLEKDIDDDRASAAIASKTEQWELEGLLSPDEIAKKALDLNLHLLRVCFHTCYYCGISCEFSEELCRKCIRHERRLPNKEENRRDARHAESDLLKITDEKAKLLTDPASVNARQLGGEDYEAELGLLCQDHIKIEEAGKFRCKTCSKLFKATNFVEKHIFNKHPDLLDVDALHRVQMLNNYVLDPNHIMPNLPQPPDPNGRPQMPPPMSAPVATYPGPTVYGPPFTLNMYPQVMGQAAAGFPPPPVPGTGVPRLSDRIGGSLPAAKRAKRDSLPPTPDNVRQDPRAQKVATSYNDLDSSVPTGEGELDY